MLLDVKKLKTYYKLRDNTKIHAVDNISFQLSRGEILGIAGESGCGKSTLALSLMFYYFPPLFFDSGEIFINNQKIVFSKRGEIQKNILGNKIAYIPQAAMNALNPTQKVKNFILDIFKEHKPHIKKKEVLQFAASRFSELNLPERVLNSYPNELSGGMRQRTIIGISTILDPDILIADEPTSALDVTSQKKVVKMLKSLLDKNFVKGIIFITHELTLLANITHNIMVMYAGQIMEYGKTNDVIFHGIHPYTKALMGSIIVAEKEMKKRQLTFLPGAPPHLKNEIKGCRFAERCSFVKNECRFNQIEEKIHTSHMYRCLRPLTDLKD
ncbi:MAG TPA: ABC transporter ATP-binding protein [Spirochaetota bacterium]|nr:ABC transporter ATP-binding protein [Spirochaetota bacterium]